MLLRERCHWIFDLDGTLTVAVHDFEAIARQLGMPADRPILEYLQTLPPHDRAARTERLDRIEAELAGAARAAAGAAELLELLTRRGGWLGILTRNSHQNALLTLSSAGLAHFFLPENVLGRDQVRPKPNPEGVLRLADEWRVEPSSCVVVGDCRFDLEVGRAVGAMTVHVDSTAGHSCGELADVCVPNLGRLRGLIERAQHR